MNHHKMNRKDSEKLERLYENYKVPMYVEANKILKDKHAAEDAVHQAFVKLIGRLDKIDESNLVKTRNFLCIVCRNIAINIYNNMAHLNSNSDYIEMVDNEDSLCTASDDSPCDMTITKESYNYIVKAIENLPTIYRDVIFLEYFHDYSKKEIADLLNISYDTVKKRSERARKMLAKVLSKEELI